MTENPKQELISLEDLEKSLNWKLYNQVLPYHKQIVREYATNELNQDWVFSDGEFPIFIKEKIFKAYGNSDKSVLDLGAGKGKTINDLHQLRALNQKSTDNLYALNLTPHLDTSSPVNEINCDLDSLVDSPYQITRSGISLAPQGFDKIITQHGPIHHSPIPGYHLLQAVKLLNPGGQLIFSGMELEMKGTTILQDILGVNLEEATRKIIADFENVKELLRV
ncbi:MAG: hypothetical protein WCK98_07100 [bacterium]